MAGGAFESVLFGQRAGRLARWCGSNACALLLAGSFDACEDVASARALAFLKAGEGGEGEELMVLVTSSMLLIHCSAVHWARTQHIVARSGVPHDVFTPAPHLATASPAALDFKLEACREMLAHAASAALPVLAGSQPLENAARTWPLLRAVYQSRPPPPPPTLTPDAASAAAASLVGLLRSVVDADIDPAHPLQTSARGLEERWSALLRCLDRAADDEALLSLTEARLEAALCEEGGATPLLLPGETVVRLGVRTGEVSGVRYAAHSAGVGRSAALHLTARAVDHRTGLSLCRTLFLSNGRPPHHWQHRVFPDGEVLEPLVEDEVGEVEGGHRTARLMRLYCALIAAARDIAAAAAQQQITGAPPLSDAEALHILLARLDGDADLRQEPGAASALVWRGLLRDAPETDLAGAAEAIPGITGGAATGTALKGLSADAKRAQAAARAARAAALGASAADAASAAGAGVPVEWLLHSVRLQLDTNEGAVAFETPFVLDGRGGWREVVGVPALSCWPSAGLETVEARAVRAAVETNSVCAAPTAPVERLRAGEHAQLQVLLTEPLDGCVLLLDSDWLPAVRGTLRLFSGGLAFDSPRFGPMVLPFRIHLASVSAFNLGAADGMAALILGQKEDEHGYGPLALLPGRSGATAPRVLTVAIAVPCRGPLHRALQDKVWPYWAKMFAELEGKVHLEVAHACPPWVRGAMRAARGAL